MSQELERILARLTEPDNAVIQQATAELKQTFKDPAIIPALCAVMTGSQNPQARQSAAVMLRMRVRKHWKKINPVIFVFVLNEHMIEMICISFKYYAVCSHISTLNSVQVGLLLLSKVVGSNPEPFKPHYKQLLQLFGTVLQDLNNPTALYYCILTLTAITAYTGTEEMNLMRSLIPKLLIALKHLIQADQDQASEAMEVFDELMESEVSIVVPHIAEIVRFCLEVYVSLSDSLRVKALSCIAVLIRLKSKAVLKHKLLQPILQVVFPILSAAPPPGEEDPEDEENDTEGDSENPKHFAVQVIDTMALHMPPEKLFNQLLPFTQACLSSENSYERKGGLMCMAVLAEGCADHIRTKMLSSMLQTVCRSLSDNNQVVRSAALFALGQFSEHLQPDVSKFHAELMPLLHGYLSSVNQTKIGHMTKAFYALENFLENLGQEIKPYLPTLMETMLSALNNAENLKLKELAVSAIANAAKEMLGPYFPPIIESLKGFLTDTREEMRALQTQALDTLSVLARTVGKEVFSPLAAECVQLGLNLTDAVDDPDLRRCTYSLFSAVSDVSPDCLAPQLTPITTVMLLSLRSTEGVTVSEDFPLRSSVHHQTFQVFTNQDSVHSLRFSVENAYIDEKEDACDALGEIAFNTGCRYSTCKDERTCVFFNYPEFFDQLLHISLYIFPALHKLLQVVLPCFLEAVRQDRERQVVMAILESMNAVIKSCQGEALQAPGILAEISNTIKDVLKKKTVCQDVGGDEADDDEQQAEYDAMLQEFAGEGIPVLASAVPAETFYPHLNDLLPLIMSKAKSSCTEADRSFSIGTIGETLHSLVDVAGGRVVAGRLSNRLLPVLVAGVKDGDAEVRNNGVFALGALAQAAGPIIASDYPVMLSLFSNLLSKESDLRVIDNLCAALCRMIMSHVQGVPLEQVFPALVARLPLKEDMEENKTIYSCLTFLYSHNPALVQAHFHSQGLAQHHTQEFESAVISLPDEQRNKITMAVTQS
uniref:Importin-4-like n=1 Tax=Sinocyclocheilus rhinocerous TaxID=307959 RepID=A0A673LU62_9TELE